LGDLFYVTIFFGVYEIVEVWIRKKFGVIEKAPALVGAPIINH